MALKMWSTHAPIPNSAIKTWIGVYESEGVAMIPRQQHLSSLIQEHSWKSCDSPPNRRITMEAGASSCQGNQVCPHGIRNAVLVTQYTLGFSHPSLPLLIGYVCCCSVIFVTFPFQGLSLSFTTTYACHIRTLKWTSYLHLATVVCLWYLRD